MYFTPPLYSIDLKYYMVRWNNYVLQIALPYGVCVYNNSPLVICCAHCLQYECTYLSDKQEQCLNMYIQKCLE